MRQAPQKMITLLISMLLCVSADGAADLSHVASFLALSARESDRPQYHVTAPVGRMGEPAAFVHYAGRYHLFYRQRAADTRQWAHATSTDLARWTYYPPALLPRYQYDARGCLGGCAVVHVGLLALLYVGASHAGRATLNLAVSADGVLFSRYLRNPVLRALPADAPRDPRVWRHARTWYMLVGASVAGRGALLLYTSADLYAWRYNATAATTAEFGRAWESPDLFEVDGVGVLALSVRGLRAGASRPRSGYVLGDFDVRHAALRDAEVSEATFVDFDHGHDFFGARTALAPDGRRLLVGRILSREADERGGCASLAREVRLGVGGRLLTPPAAELRTLRGERLEAAWYAPGEHFSAGSRSFELVVNASSAERDAALVLEWGGRRRYTVAYSARQQRVWVMRGGGAARGAKAPGGAPYWRVFVDRGSVEVFAGAGEVVFSSRLRPRRSLAVRVAGDSQLHVVQYSLRRSVGFDAKLNNMLKKKLRGYRQRFDYP